MSILQVSSGFETDEDILRDEYAWMEKLQSRSMGINSDPPQREDRSDRFMYDVGDLEVLAIGKEPAKPAQ